MRDWRDLTTEEKKAALRGRTSAENDRIHLTNFRAVINSLDANSRACRIAWKIPRGNYLINTPEEIIKFCKEN